MGCFGTPSGCLISARKVGDTVVFACGWVVSGFLVFFCGPVGGDGSDREASQKTCGYFATYEQAAVCAMTTRDSMQAGGDLNLVGLAHLHMETYCQGKSCCRFSSVEGC